MSRVLPFLICDWFAPDLLIVCAVQVAAANDSGGSEPGAGESSAFRAAVWHHAEPRPTAGSRPGRPGASCQGV